MELSEKEKCCCFTGHRPVKLDKDENYIKDALASVLERTIAAGFTDYITGMATGFDIWAAECVLTAKKSNPSVRLICALPHPGFDSRRTSKERALYKKITASADVVEEICKHYFTGCYQVRNEWMVDRSSLVIAAYSGQPSGTKNTVDYAEKCGVRVLNIL